MSKRWIMTSRVQPPVNRTLMVRSHSGELAGSVFDAAFSRFFGWQMVLPGGTLEKIEAPEMLFIDEDWARDHPSNRIAPNYSQKIRRSRKPVQS